MQGCALAAPGRLRRLTFGLGRLKKKSGRPSGRLDFGFCENPKRNQQTYRNGMERNKKKLHCAPPLPLARKAKALKTQCNSIACVICTLRFINIKLGHASCFASVVSLPVHGPAFLSIERRDKASN